MILEKMSLTNFRSYAKCDVQFGNGVNVIVGPNGSGKTNLAESIHLMSLAKSWRTNESSTLIGVDYDYAYAEARVNNGGTTKTIGIQISQKGKRVLINGKPIRRLSELSKCVNVVVFSPEDVSLFKGSPSDRRSFLDVNISKRSLDYFSLIAKYNKLLEERNATLKSEQVDTTYLKVVTERLIEVEEPISRYRRLYVDELNKVLSEVASGLYGAERSVRINYKPFIKSDEEFKSRATKLYDKSLESDIYHKSTSIGLHREDFELMLDGKNIALYGSQGENRLSAIALKMSPYFLIEDDDQKPIAVLDDVYSELDNEHAARLTELVNKMGQTFITATKLEIEGATYIDVSSNKAVRRK